MSSRRIATVVRIRELQERLARADVARARAAAQVAASHERQCWDSLAERDAASRGMLPAGTFAHRAHALAGGRAAALRAGGRTVAAQAATADALDRWTVAARDHDGVERLAERIRAEAREADERRAATELDELVVQRFTARRERR